MNGLLSIHVYSEKNKPIWQCKKRFFQGSYTTQFLGMKIDETIQTLRTKEYTILGSSVGKKKFYVVSTSNWSIQSACEVMNEIRKVDSYEEFQEIFRLYTDKGTDIMAECEDLITQRKEDTIELLNEVFERGETISHVADATDRQGLLTNEMKIRSKNLKSTFDCNAITLFIIMALLLFGFIATIVLVLVIKYVIIK